MGRKKIIHSIGFGNFLRINIKSLMDTLSESRLTEWTFIDLISHELSKGHRQVLLTLDGCANIQLLL